MGQSPRCSRHILYASLQTHCSFEFPVSACILMWRREGLTTGHPGPCPYGLFALLTLQISYPADLSNPTYLSPLGFKSFSCIPRNSFKFLTFAF